MSIIGPNEKRSSVNLPEKAREVLHGGKVEGTSSVICVFRKSSRVTMIGVYSSKGERET